MSLFDRTEYDAECALMDASIEEKARSGMWTTKEGKQIYVKEMSNGHLINALIMCAGCGEMDPWVARLKDELLRRIDGIDRSGKYEVF